MLLTCGSAGAAVIYQTDFESPTFSPGPIGGQDNWEDNETGNMVVENSFAKSGTQALHFLGTSFDAGHEPLNETVAGRIFTFENDYLHSGRGDTQATMAISGEKFIAQIGFVNS